MTLARADKSGQTGRPPRDKQKCKMYIHVEDIANKHEDKRLTSRNVVRKTHLVKMLKTSKKSKVLGTSSNGTWKDTPVEA